MISNLNGSGSPKTSGFYRFAVQVRVRFDSLVKTLHGLGGTTVESFTKQQIESIFAGIEALWYDIF